MDAMKILIAIIGAVVLIGVGYVLWVNGPSPEEVQTLQEQMLVCTDGTEIDVAWRSNDSVIVTLDGVPYELPQVISASGARYANSDESFVFWNNGNESMILVDDELVHEGCRVPGTEPAPNDEEDVSATSSVADLIRNVSVEADDVIESPLTLSGEARGQWYFEATFPVTLTDWDGLIIAEGYAEAQSDWMTTEFVPFEATLEFASPYEAGDPDFMKRGSLILQKANASGLPENDAAYETTVYFAE